MFTEENYRELSRDVYRIGPQSLTYEPKLRVGKIIDMKDIQYKIPAFFEDKSLLSIIHVISLTIYIHNFKIPIFSYQDFYTNY